MAREQTEPGSILAREHVAYKKAQRELWERFQGDFALLKGDNLIGVYPNREMALAKGYERFGGNAFMVKEIFAPGMEPVYYITGSFVQ